MATTKASAKNIDFSKVKDGGQFNKARIPAGDYLAKIIKVEDAKAKDDVFQYLFTIQIVKRPSSKHPYYCKLVENQLWKLRNLFIAAGKSVPKSKIKVDPNQLVGKLIGVTVEDDEYENKEQSTIVGVFPAAELDDDSANVDIDDSDDDEDEDDNGDDLDVSDDEDDEDEDEADDEEADDSDEFDAMTRNELKAYITERDSSFQARKSQSDDDLRSIARGLDNSGDDDEDEEDEPEPPKKAAKPAIKAAPAKKAAKKKVDEVTDEDLEELDIDDL